MVFDAETARLEELIAREDAGKKATNKPLAEKIAHNRERNRLQEALRQHRLNYFELEPRNERPTPFDPRVPHRMPGFFTSGAG